MHFPFRQERAEPSYLQARSTSGAGCGRGCCGEGPPAPRKTCPAGFVHFSRPGSGDAARSSADCPPAPRLARRTLRPRRAPAQSSGEEGARARLPGAPRPLGLQTPPLGSRGSRVTLVISQGACHWSNLRPTPKWEVAS